MEHVNMAVDDAINGRHVDGFACLDLFQVCVGPGRALDARALMLRCP